MTIASSWFVYSVAPFCRFLHKFRISVAFLGLEILKNISVWFVESAVLT